MQPSAGRKKRNNASRNKAQFTALRQMRNKGHAGEAPGRREAADGIGEQGVSVYVSKRAGEMRAPVRFLYLPGAKTCAKK